MCCGYLNWSKVKIIVFENPDEQQWRFRFSEGRKEMFYLTTHSTHFIYGYLVKNYVDPNVIAVEII